MKHTCPYTTLSGFLYTQKRNQQSARQMRQIRDSDLFAEAFKGTLGKTLKYSSSAHAPRSQQFTFEEGKENKVKKSSSGKGKYSKERFFTYRSTNTTEVQSDAWHFCSRSTALQSSPFNTAQGHTRLPSLGMSALGRVLGTQSQGP